MCDITIFAVELKVPILCRVWFGHNRLVILDAPHHRHYRLAEVVVSMTAARGFRYRYPTK
jgi:hypothetical protein